MTVGEVLQRDKHRDAVEHVQNPNQDYLTFGSQQRFSALLSDSAAVTLTDSFRPSVRPPAAQIFNFKSNLCQAINRLMRVFKLCNKTLIQSCTFPVGKLFALRRRPGALRESGI